VKLSELFAGLGEAEIHGLHYDSRKIKAGFVFFAVPGFKEDGTKYLPQAFASGAALAVVQKGHPVPSEFMERCFFVEDVRKAMADAAYRFHGRPTDKLKLFGITGTKGKTSTTYLLDSILQVSGIPSALLGTVECRHPGAHFPSERTTMESLDLQGFLADAVKHGAKNVAMEVSSHALSLDRVRNCQFDGALFTNLSEDHLDFYDGMESYFQAKKLLFTNFLKSGGVGAINIEDSYGARLANELKLPLIRFGIRSGDLYTEELSISDKGIRCNFKSARFGSIPIRSDLVGEFNVLNLLGAAALALGAGFSQEVVSRGIANLRAFPGRLERVPSSQPFSVFVDFAHQGQALDNVLRSLRPLCKGKLVVVFGAGGDRDPARRTQLGSVAARLADYSYITSDNPRTEDPAKIIAAVEAAFLQSGGRAEQKTIEPDRKSAIRKALEAAKAGDIICIAGKGHETGQIIGRTVHPFDDRVEAALVLRELEAR
jgi:UDP-N-acetylmuramoyl-L-alanyl-D-glutamate--2,6-diaminopimelate ligase